MNQESFQIAMGLLWDFIWLITQIVFFFKATLKIPELINKKEYGIVNGIFIVQGILNIKIATIIAIWVIFKLLDNN